jgi:Rrf2 family protein
MITKKAEYAIITLTELAANRHGDRITTREIAEKRHIPLNLVIQLISVLKSAGWVASTRGPAGGIRLACDPARITLRQVVELVDGPIGITRCLLQDGPCNNQVDCPLRGVWSRAQGEMLKVLEQVTIKELADRTQIMSSSGAHEQTRNIAEGGERR